MLITLANKPPFVVPKRSSATAGADPRLLIEPIKARVDTYITDRSGIRSSLRAAVLVINGTRPLISDPSLRGGSLY